MDPLIAQLQAFVFSLSSRDYCEAEQIILRIIHDDPSLVAGKLCLRLVYRNYPMLAPLPRDTDIAEELLRQCKSAPDEAKARSRKTLFELCDLLADHTTALPSTTPHHGLAIHSPGSPKAISLFLCGYFIDFLEDNPTAAADIFQRVHDMDCVYGTNSLGYCYYSGQGVPRDTGMAFRMYASSSSRMNAYGLNNLGYCLERAIGTECLGSDAPRILHSLTLPEIQANAMYDTSFDLVIPPNSSSSTQALAFPDLAFHAYRLAADLGSADAQNNLGSSYEHGDGTNISPNAARRWYSRAAQQGYSYGQNNSGYCYCLGVGCTADLRLAVDSFRRSASNGFSDAMFNLGLCLEDGQGTPSDRAEAVSCYVAALKEGNTSAEDALASL